MIRLTRDFAPGITVFIAALMLVCATGMPAAASQAVAAPSPSKAPPSRLVATSASLTPLTDEDLQLIRGGGKVWKFIKAVVKFISDLCEWIEEWWRKNWPQISQPYTAAEAGDDGCYEVDEDVTVNLYALNPEGCPIQPEYPELDDVVTDGPDPYQCGEVAR